MPDDLPGGGGLGDDDDAAWGKLYLPASSRREREMKLNRFFMMLLKKLHSCSSRMRLGVATSSNETNTVPVFSHFLSLLL